MAKVKDIYGKNYNIPDLGLFKNHIKNFHTVNGYPDNSIHEENGYYFKIDERFYNSINNLSSE
tara:strand:+ start:450 stop:638 length:189 start_codon:yes stop_codon:yes gene_type:complete